MLFFTLLLLRLRFVLPLGLGLAVLLGNENAGSGEVELTSLISLTHSLQDAFHFCRLFFFPCNHSNLLVFTSAANAIEKYVVNVLDKNLSYDDHLQTDLHTET